MPIGDGEFRSPRIFPVAGLEISAGRERNVAGGRSGNHQGGIVELAAIIKDLRANGGRFEQSRRGREVRRSLAPVPGGTCPAASC